jgi:hypothetical protein
MNEAHISSLDSKTRSKTVPHPFGTTRYEADEDSRAKLQER